tara:strand:- start:2186 stop:2728 length:543 start_codon:yes stop_codon:yes gene_type:complete
MKQNELDLFNGTEEDQELRKIVMERLSYDSRTGLFKWKRRVAQHVPKGSKAGYLDKNKGYIKIRVVSRAYMAHRLAWLIVYGSFPPDQIDHINGIKHDNRIINLRAVTNIENCRNKSLPNINTSGHIGIHYNKRMNKWTAAIGINYKQVHLGSFENKEDAIEARRIAEINYNYHPNHGRD